MCSRLYFRHTSGSPVTRFQPDIAISSRAARVLPGRIAPDGLGQLPQPPPVGGSLCDGRISAASLYGMRMNSKTCNRKRKKKRQKNPPKKKNLLRICLKRLVFCSCVVLAHFHYVWVGFVLLLLLLLLHLHCNDVMKPCRDGRQMYIT